MKSRRSWAIDAVCEIVLLIVFLAWGGGVAAAAQLTLRWTDAATNESGFAIERRQGLTGTFTQVATVGTNVTSYVDPSLAANTTYCYQVYAFNTAGNSARSNVSCGTTAATQQFRLAVSIVGNGTVVSNPTGISCPGDCIQDYVAATQVQLTPTPLSGWQFGSWGGDCVGQGSPCVLTMSAIKNVSVTFVQSSGGTGSGGVYRNGAWYVDKNGNGQWDGCGIDGCYAFGATGDQAVAGDWNGNGRTEIGVYRSGIWYLDKNGNGQWDGCGIDGCYTFGANGDQAVAGDWNGDGRADIGVYRSGTWYLDKNGNGQWDGCGIDSCYTFGANGDQAVAGDWNGDGRAEIGVYRNGAWYLDKNSNGQWDGCGIDGCYAFGASGDKAVAGDWDRDGRAEVGVYRSGVWYLDNGNGQWDGCGIDGCSVFGAPTDQPELGKW